MLRFRTLRRLLSRARQDWHEVAETLFGRPAKPHGPRPLRVMRLERRRVLSADFSLSASSLILDGFDQGGDSLAITQQGDAYLFTADQGWNSEGDDALPSGVSIQGETLSVQRNLLDGLSGGLTVAGDGQSNLSVTLGDADFSAAAGPVSILSPTSLDQQPFSLFSAPADGIRLGVASPGLTVTSLNVAGDLEVTSFGKITDAENTQIVITGNATFVSNAASPDADFDGDGVVSLTEAGNDYDNWVAGYGYGASAPNAAKYDGDANGDGVVNAADYTLLRDSSGESLSGGIELADSPGDRLVVGGSVTFDAATGGRHLISIGVNSEGRDGWVELGTITALGSDVQIIEDAPSDISRVEAYDFNLTSSGEIYVGNDAEIHVENTVTLTSLFRDFQGDFDNDGDIDLADRDRWTASYGTTFGPTEDSHAAGDANGNGVVDAADYAIWRDGFDGFDPATTTEDLEGGIIVADGARFEAGGLVSLVARDFLNDSVTGEPVEARFDITVQDGATARFSSLALDGGKIKVVEDAGAFNEERDGDQDGTVIAGIDAEQLLLVSYGPISSTGSADINVFGGDDVEADATFASTGSIVLADTAGRDVQIDGEATFIAGVDGSEATASIRVGVDVGGIDSGALVNFGGLRFTAPSQVRIAEDSSTEILGWTTYVRDECLPDEIILIDNNAGSLELQSNGRITDANDALTVVGGNAAFRVNAVPLDGSEPAIELADQALPSLNGLFVGGYATFIDSTDTGIEVGTDGNRLPGPKPFDAGRLRFHVGPTAAVTINEGSDSELGSWASAPIDFLTGTPLDRSTAGSLELLSRGSLTDESGAILRVEDDATLVAFGGLGASTDRAIQLADDDSAGSTNQIDIDGTAAFVDASAVGAAVSGIDVGVAVNGAPAEATFVADKLRFSSPNGTVRLAEDESTQLAGWAGNDIGVLASAGDPMESVAIALELWSAGSITDDADAMVHVAGDATLIANDADLDGDAIRIADANDSSNQFRVTGLATFIAGEDDVANTIVGNLALGVTGTGIAADARFESGSLRFFAQGAETRIAEDSPALVLADWTNAAFPALTAETTPSASEAELIEVFSAGSITDTDSAKVFARGENGNNAEPSATAAFIATTDIVLADEGGNNRLVIDGVATLAAGNAEQIDVGVVSDDPAGIDDGVAADAVFHAGKLRFFADGGVTRIAEDSSAVLTSWEADSLPALLPGPVPTGSLSQTLELSAVGSITDMKLAAEDTLDVVVDVTGLGGAVDPMANATFVATEDIVLADGGAGNELAVDGITTFVVGTGRKIDVGIISDEPAGPDDGAPANAMFNTRTLRFYADSGTVRIAEDSSTILTNWEGDTISPLIGFAPTQSVAQEVELLSAGSITDAKNQQSDVSDVVVRIIAPASGTADATFVATTTIVFADADDLANQLVIDDQATFIAGDGQPIDVGVSGDGSVAMAEFTAGSLRFSAPSGTVRLAEDATGTADGTPGTVLAGWTGAEIDVLGSTAEPASSAAGSLELWSNGTITDSDDAIIGISGDARFVVADTAGIADADEGGFVQAIVLADDNDTPIANELTVGGMAEFLVEPRAPSLAPEFDGPKGIDVGVQQDGTSANALFTSGPLRFSAPDALVRIAEDDGTLFADGTSDSATLELRSDDAITDATNAVLDITGDARFTAASNITLADGGSSSNQLLVEDLAQFFAGDGSSVDVGVQVDGSDAGEPARAVFNTGQIQFFALNGTVRIAEDSDTEVADDVSGSMMLQLVSAGAITDADTAAVRITDSATFVAKTSITLADAGSANLLLVDQHAAFEAGDNLFVDVGVDPASGVPADAEFTSGSLQFKTVGGTVRLAEDDATQIGAAVSRAADLRLRSDGEISDATGADTEIGRTAELNANDGNADIVLGDEARFSMGTPVLFDESMYLAMDASNVSVRLQSAVNVRTSSTAPPAEDEYGLVDADFAGTYFLTATGNITQVGGEALTADKVSLASMAAVFMTGLVLNHDGKESDGALSANLQVKAGTPLALDAATFGAVPLVDRYGDQDIPSSENFRFLPVIVESDNEVSGQRADVSTNPNALVQPRSSSPTDEFVRFDEGFEDLFFPDESEGLRNARLSEALFDSKAEADAANTVSADTETFQHALPSDLLPLQPRSIRDDYSAVIIVDGNAIVGDVQDATQTVDAAAESVARGFEVTSNGNAYLRTEAAPSTELSEESSSDSGELVFTSANREGDASTNGIVVQMSGGVFTAVADGVLSIDTAEGNLPTGSRTSLLESLTGAVSDISTFEDDGTAAVRGPRVLLDPSSEQANAATTGLVRADTDFEQRITLAVGSRGEDNVLVEIEWADVADIRGDSRANLIDVNESITARGDFDLLAVPGSTEFADLTQTPNEAIGNLKADNDRLEYQELSEGPENFRVATLRHNFEKEFVPSNPAQDSLPTTVRVYNDPYINLYDNAIALVADAEGNDAEVRDLNSVSFMLAPRIAAVEGGFFLPIESDPPREIVPQEVVVIASEPLTAEQPANNDVGRAVVTSNAETLEYGRIDDETKEWIENIPGEAWPQVQDEIEGDYLRQIRDRIDNGPFSEGTYQIQIVTPRGEQVLEVWVKGDLGEESGVLEDEALWDEPLGPDDTSDEPAPDSAPELLPEAQLIQPPPTGGAILGEPGEATETAANTAIAAIATVGGWRRRLGSTGAFKLEEDGVAFTRVRRRRRRARD